MTPGSVHTFACLGALSVERSDAVTFTKKEQYM